MRTEVEEILGAGLVEVGAESGGVEDVDDFGEAEGESIFEGVDAFGHA